MFAVFDRDALLDELTDEITWGQISPDAMFTAAGNLTTKYKDGGFENALSMANWNVKSQATGLNQNNITSTGVDNTGTVSNQVKKNHEGKSINIPQGFDLINRQNILYADMLPTLDVTLTYANEYGQAAFQKIYDLDFLNEGSGASVDSIVMEREMSWIARRLSPILTGVYNSSQGQMTAKPILA